MRVICPHRSKNAINAMSQTIKDLYCQCANTKDCGIGFVFVLAFKRDLNPPVKTTLQIAASLMNNLKPDQRKRLQVDLFGQDALRWQATRQVFISSRTDLSPLKNKRHFIMIFAFPIRSVSLDLTHEEYDFSMPPQQKPLAAAYVLMPSPAGIYHPLPVVLHK